MLSQAAPSLALQCWQLFSSCLIPPQRENRKERRGGAEGATLVRGSERGDVIECVVQLLADGLVLHLLRVDFVWRGPGTDGSVGRGNRGEEERQERG